MYQVSDHNIRPPYWFYCYSPWNALLFHLNSESMLSEWGVQTQQNLVSAYEWWMVSERWAQSERWKICEHKIYSESPESYSYIVFYRYSGKNNK